MRLRAPSSAGLLLVAALALALPAAAEDAAQRSAREELERELGQLVEKPPTRIKVIFLGFEDPNYRLEDATFELDGSPLKAPALSLLSTEGEHPLFSGDIAPGRHLVHARITIANDTSVVISDEGGYRWKVSGEVGFDLYSGIELQVRITPRRESGQKELKNRFKLNFPATPVMLARLDDGKMPEPVIAKKPVLIVDAGPPPAVDAGPPPAVDAGPPPAVVAAADPKKQEPPPGPVAVVRRPEPREPRPPPEPRAPQPVEPPVVAVVAAEAVDAGASAVAAAGVIDAGPPIAVAVSPPPAAPVPIPEDDSKWIGWALFAAGAVIVALGLLFISRRRPLPPSGDD